MYMIIISNMHAQSCVCVFLLAENRKKFEQTTTVCLRFIEGQVLLVQKERMPLCPPSNFSKRQSSLEVPENKIVSEWSEVLQHSTLHSDSQDRLSRLPTRNAMSKMYRKKHNVQKVSREGLERLSRRLLFELGKSQSSHAPKNMSTLHL